MDITDSFILKEEPYQRYRNLGGLGLLKLCRSIHDEATGVLYSSSQFCIGGGKGAGWFLRWVEGIGGNVRFIRRLDIRMPKGWVDEWVRGIGDGKGMEITGVSPRDSVIYASSLYTTGARSAHADISTTEIGKLVNCLACQNPNLRELIFRLDVTLFKETDCAELNRNHAFMLWLAATCVAQHSRLKFAS
jgi:hypothetical protein